MRLSNNWPMTLLLCLGWLMAGPALADEETKALLKALSRQISELKQHAERSDVRVEQLENELRQYRAERQLAVKPAVEGSAGGIGLAAGPAAQTVASTSAVASDKAKDKPAVTVGDVKGTFKIPGTDTSIGLGGFVKMDAMFSSVSAGRDKLGDQQMLYSEIPVGAAGERAQTTFHAKESRLWLKSFTPSRWGDINTYVEFDFFGDAATYVYTPRLRHAYGSIGNFLAGQTYTTFLNVAAIPDHLDIGGSAGGLTTLRQPLVRWSQPFSWAGTPMEWQLAVESPRSRLWVNNQLEPTTVNRAGSLDPNTDSYFMNPSADRYPDMLARVNFNPDWGNLSLAAMGRQIRYSKPNGFEQTGWGGSANLAGKISTFGLDNLRFMMHYGNAHGRYISTINTFSDASLDASGHMDLTVAYGAMLSYQHWWSKQWRSSLTYGFSQADQPDYVNRVLNRQVQSLHANLLWSPVSQAMLGVEYAYGNRELIDGREGDVQRVQFSAKYSF